MHGHFTVTDSKISSMIMTIDCIFKVGFKPFGLQFSDSSSLSSDSEENHEAESHKMLEKYHQLKKK
jgi:hypothetical protein